METTIFSKGIKRIIKRIIKPKFLYFFYPRHKPLSNYYGLDRGQAIDRYYIEKFLDQNRQAITGHCLEVLNNDYSLRYGKKITKSDILDIDTNNKAATIYGDLRQLNNIPDNTFDCIILTQVLQFIDDGLSAIKNCERILKPGGTLLATLPSISRIDCVSGAESDYWRFTVASAKYLFSKIFNNFEISSVGNVKAGLYFWIGLATEEISKKDLDYDDKNFPCLITVKATKNA